jgi:hypothetical protein
MVVPVLLRSRLTSMSTNTNVQWSRAVSRANVYRVHRAIAFDARFKSQEGSR